MARIFPNNSSCNYNSLERETFTVWMKSLVFHSNGCTIFNSKGDLVYRVDNYQQRCSSKAFLMDSSGNVLFSINRKKPRIFGCWEGFKWSGNSKVDKEGSWFQVKRNYTILSKYISCRVTLNCNNKNTKKWYEVVGLEGKSTLKIIDQLSGQLLAEAVQVQKQSGRVCLGEDVLTLMVEPKADQSLVMALVTVYGLINNKL